MTGRLRFFGNQGDEGGRVLTVAFPIFIMLVAIPFTKPEGTSVRLAQAIVSGLGAASIGLVALYVLFLIVRPQGWKPRQSAVLAETITLWVAAGITVAHTI